MEAVQVSGPTKDIYELRLSHDELAELQGDVATVVFHSPETDEISSRYLVVEQGSCTFVVATGAAGWDNVTVTGSEGGEVQGNIAYGGADPAVAGEVNDDWATEPQGPGAPPQE